MQHHSLNVGAVGQQFRIDLMPPSRQMRLARDWIDTSERGMTTSGRIAPFREPSRNVRYLREADGRVLARLKSPLSEFLATSRSHVPEYACFW
jgi:hypothetical protein